MSRTRAKKAALGARIRTAPATAISPGACGRQAVLDDLTVLQVGELAVGESERTSQHGPHLRIDADLLRGRRGRGTHQEREQGRPRIIA